jgi:hypothetical protein
VIAGLGAWLLAATLPGLPARQQNPSAPASSPVIQTVQVNQASFIGQPVSSVTQALTQLGLTPAVTYTGSGQDQFPGTVISVEPNGPVPAGSTVTVTAVSLGGFGHHHHDFQGDNGT